MEDPVVVALKAHIAKLKAMLANPPVSARARDRLYEALALSYRSAEAMGVAL